MLSEDQLIYTRAVTSSSLVAEPEQLTELPTPQQTAYFMSAEQVEDYSKLTVAFNCADLEKSYQLKMLGIYAKTEREQREVLYKVLVYADEEGHLSLPAGQNLTYRFVITDSIGQGHLTVEVAPDAAAPIEHVSNANRHLFTQVNSTRPAVVDSGERHTFSQDQRILFVPKIALSAGEDTITCAGVTFPLQAVDLAGKEVDCVFLPHRSYVLRYEAESQSFIYTKHDQLEYPQGVGHYWDGERWQTLIEAGRLISRLSDSPPPGTLLCDGSSLEREAYPELFAVLGERFGSLDESHFNLPNLVGRCLIGAGANYDLGALGGEAEHTLSVEELPTHNHQATLSMQSLSHSHGHTISLRSAGNHRHLSGILDNNYNEIFHYGYEDVGTQYNRQGIDANAEHRPRYVGYTDYDGAHTHSISLSIKSASLIPSGSISVKTSGSGQPHSLMQPYLAVNYFIYTGRVLL